MLRAVQSTLLWAYRGARRSGLLDTRMGRGVFESAYWGYKSVVEARDVDALRTFVAPGSTAVDVGANIGFLTVRFAEWVGEAGRVLAIEPEAANFASLGARVARRGLSGRVQLVRAAAVDAPGQVLLQLNPDNPADHRVADSGVPVEAVTLDDLLASATTPRVSLIKVDVQGGELRVLRGARRTLESMRPALFVELHEPSLAQSGTSARALLDEMAALGYAPHVAGRDARWHAIARDELRARMDARGYVDVLLLAG